MKRIMPRGRYLAPQDVLILRQPPPTLADAYTVIARDADELFHTYLRWRHTRRFAHAKR